MTKYGYLDTMLGGSVAFKLQMLRESYLNYGNACKIVAVLPYRSTDLMMFQGVDRPNTTPIGHDRKFKDLRFVYYGCRSLI